MTEKIRIKDIAERAGTSVGTVDRVLHGRPNVSPGAREKIERALKEMNYHPNMYASALASNRSYTFALLMPRYESEAYWQEIETGAVKACEARRDFHIGLEIIYYDRFVNGSFVQQSRHCLDIKPDGVIIVPADLETTQPFTERLHALEVPFVLLDSNIPDLKPLAFFGQDSFCSGFFAAKMLMLIAGQETAVMLMRLVRDGRVVSRQQENREVGFKNYMEKHFPHIRIVELNMPTAGTTADYEPLMDEFFKQHPEIHHCITFNSKAHIVGDYLLRKKRKDVKIMGYDMVNKNALCLREGTISFLIAQHAYVQVYACMEALFNAIVMKQEITPVNYMPIELITRENMDFYRRTLY